MGVNVIKKDKQKLELLASDYFSVYLTARVCKIIQIVRGEEYVVFDIHNDCVVSVRSSTGSQTKFSSIEDIVEAFGSENIHKVELRRYDYGDWHFVEV